MTGTRVTQFASFVLSCVVGIATAADAQTENQVAKFNSAGSPVDSAIKEANGNVAIASCTDCGYKLAVGGPTHVHDSVTIDQAADWGGSLVLANTAKTGSAARMWTFFNTTGSAGNGLLLYSQPANGTPSCCIPRFWIADSGDTHLVPSGGNVGIGTTSPSTKLHVIGDVTVTGNIAAKYQDVAEWVPADSAVPAGTVVVVDPDASNGVQASASAYDTAVAGVISAQPGVVLGEPGPGKVLAAQSGRVRVRANTSNGAIRAGDLLVTSGRPGEAMRSEPVAIGSVTLHRPGTILGKALEALSDGRGEILVLLTLQ
jgi:hypothetical protein